jgi:uncharacterized protein (DUF433 family)
MPELDMTQSVPLTRSDDGVLRITGSRVTLDSIVHEFKRGATAEQIQEDFPTISLSEVYSVIAYYLQHSCAVDDYLSEQARECGEVRREIEGGMDTKDLRERLRQRRIQSAS